MRKSFKIIVLLSVLFAASLVLAIYFVPFRGSNISLIQRLTEKGISTSGVSYSEIAKESYKRIRTSSYSAVNMGVVSSDVEAKKVNIKKRVYNNLIGFDNYFKYAIVINQSAKTQNYVSFYNAQNAFITSVSGNIDELKPNNEFLFTQSSSMPSQNVAASASTDQALAIATNVALSQSSTTASGRQGANGGPPPDEDNGGPLPSLPIGDGSLILVVFITLFLLKKTIKP